MFWAPVVTVTLIPYLMCTVFQFPPQCENQATANAERRLEEAARKHEEDLLEAFEKRKLQDQVSLFVTKHSILIQYLCHFIHLEVQG